MAHTRVEPPSHSARAHAASPTATAAPVPPPRTPTAALACAQCVAGRGCQSAGRGGGVVFLASSVLGFKLVLGPAAARLIAPATPPSAPAAAPLAPVPAQCRDLPRRVLSTYLTVRAGGGFAATPVGHGPRPSRRAASRAKLRVRVPRLRPGGPGEFRAGEALV